MSGSAAIRSAKNTASKPSHDSESDDLLNRAIGILSKSEPLSNEERDRLSQCIQEIKSGYCAYANNVSRRPRPKSVIDQLENIEREAKRLARLLEDAFDETLDCLHGGPVPLLLRSQNDRLWEIADGKQLPPFHDCGGLDPNSIADLKQIGTNHPLYDEWCRWTPRLKALSLLARKAKERARNGFGSSDKGGSRNLQRERWGHEKWWLAYQCGVLFELERGKISAKENKKDFSRFVADVYGFTSGKDPEGKGSGLEAHIKKAIKYFYRPIGP